MPRRDDLKTILLIGSGPIVIGQACEFDYSGTQAARALRNEGYRVVLVNSNPATIMTDPMTADKIYLEPLTTDSIKRIVEIEQVDAVLPTMGGQTALNLAERLHEEGFWKAKGIDIIGVDIDAIAITEDRQQFRDLMARIGLDQANSRVARSLLEAKEIAQELGGVPIVIRPSYTLGGTGGGIIWNPEDFDKKVTRGLEMSPVHEVLVEECLFGWKEYELELLRDKADNVVIICSIENVDPMGVHTGDSVTVAPQQTLTDAQYQGMRDAAIRAMRSIGTFAGGCNIQFAVHPQTGRLVVIEINPRVSRSSALASKATGYPIAKVAARLAVGYTLDELKNEVTGTTSACFEPSIDYVVTKIPRFNFDKFEGVDEELTTQMKAVGEVMAIGRTFEESLQKAWQSLEIGYAGLGGDRETPPRAFVRDRLARPRWDRTLRIHDAFRHGASVEEVADVTKVDPWFLHRIKGIVEAEREIETHTLETLDAAALRRFKRMGFGDVQLAYLLQGAPTENAVRARRKALGVTPVFAVVDTCAGEFEAVTPYFYSTYETPERVRRLRPREGAHPRLRAEPHRAGHRVRLQLRPRRARRPRDGLRGHHDQLQPRNRLHRLRHGGQALLRAGVLGARLRRDRAREAEGRHAPDGRADGAQARAAVRGGRGGDHRHALPQHGRSRGPGQVLRTAQAARNPVPALRHGHQRRRGRGRVGAHRLPDPRAPELRARRAGHAHRHQPGRGARVCGPHSGAVSAATRSCSTSFSKTPSRWTVDAICDGDEVWISGVMQHIEPAGVHSGDSTAVLPPYSLSDETVATLRQYVTEIAKGLGVVGMINVQLAVQRGTVYVIEANPRASRTVPFVAKATGVPTARLGAKVMLGAKIAEFRAAGLLGVEARGLRDQGAGLLMGQVPRGIEGTGARDEVHRRGHRLRRHPHRRALPPPLRDAQPLPEPVGRRESRARRVALAGSHARVP